MSRRCLSAAVLLLHYLATAAAADDPPAGHSFRIKVDLSSAMTAGDAKTSFAGEAAYGFTWRGDGREKTLRCDGISLKVVADGKQYEERVDRNGGESLVDGKRQPDPSPEEREAVRKGFDLPLCTIRYDEHGVETAREENADEAVAQFRREGLVDYATLFFAPYYADREQWTSAKNVPFGRGRKARGRLTYERKSVAGGLVTVKVAGKLEADEFQDPVGRTIRVVRFRLEGEQVYDTGRKRWTTGTLAMESDLEAPDDAQGRIAMTSKTKLHLQPAAPAEQ